MSKSETRPVDEPTSEPDEPTSEPTSATPSPVDLATAKVTEAQTAVNTLTTQADGLLAEFNTVAMAQPVDTAKLLELARARDDIMGSAERPGKLARATAALSKAKAALTDVTWELDAAKRDALVAAFRDGLPERPADIPIPTIVIAPLDEELLAQAIADARVGVAVATWRVGVLESAATAVGLLELGCDRIRVAQEQMANDPQPVFSVKPVRTGQADSGATRKPATHKPGNGGARARATYSVDGGASMSARELADQYEPEWSANVQSKIDGGASLSHTHLADSIMARLNKEGHTVTKNV